MNIRIYTYPASINGVEIEDSAVGIGWYNIATPDGEPREHQRETSPMFVHTKSSGEFDLMQNWFRDVFFDLWEDSLTLYEVYENQDSKPLERWVASNADERVELIEEMSGDHPTTRAEMFG